MPNNQIGPIIVRLRQHARANDDVQLDALVDELECWRVRILESIEPREIQPARQGQ